MAVIVEGLASTPDFDSQKHVVEPGCFDLSVLPPLLYKHDPKKPAGSIIALEQRPEGLWVKARVELDEAKDATHFSVCFNVREFTYEHQYTSKQRRIINEADLVEISLTTNPGNSACRITAKVPVIAIGEFYEHLITKTNKLKELIQYVHP